MSRGKSLEELLNDLVGVAEPDSSVERQIRAAIDVRVTQETTRSLRRWAMLSAVAACVSAVTARVSVVGF